MKPSRLIFPLALVAGVLALGWYFRPLLHSYIISIWIEPLGTLLLTIAFAAVITASGLYAVARVKTIRGRSHRINGFWINGLVLLAIGLFLGSIFYKVAASDIRLAQAYKTYNFQDIAALPADDQSRTVPLAVAERFGADSLQRPTERAHSWYPQLWDGQFAWVAGLTPNGVVRRWLDQASGLQIVNATTAQRQTSVVDQKFKFSEGVQLTDNLRWQLYKKRYFINLPEVYHAKVDGKIYAVAPILAYRGFLIRHPVLDGAFVVSADGAIEELTVEQAKAHPAVRAAGRLYPESYARFVHESYALKGGVLNKWFRHVDQTEISDPAGERNAQPYMLSTKDGLMWLSAADPWGQSFGIYKVFITDAITGEHRLYSVSKDASLTGASQAIGYVKSARPEYNWRVEGADDAPGAGNILAIEPRPVFIQNQLYWMISVTTTEAKGINETCFVNAKDNRVTCAVNDEEIKSFVTIGAVKPGAGTPPAASPTPSGTPAPGTPGNKERIDKLEATLRQALRELEELKAAQPQ